jgi:non-heme chloroperoxidase
LFEKLDLKDAIMVGHSTGGGEVARYLGRHGTKRVAKAALISAITPLMLKTEKNPLGAPVEVFDGLRAALAANRPQFYIDITMPFYGFNRPGAKISEGIRQHWWLQGMAGSVKAHYECIRVFSETDTTEDLKKIDIPVLVMHSKDDQIVPIAAAGPAAAKLLKYPTLKVYEDLPHGMPATHPDIVNAELLAFFKGAATTASA